MPRRPPRLASREVRLQLEETNISVGLAGDADDEQLARLLVRMWSLASGRTVRTDVPPHQLTEDELIVFWADDFSPACGRHAAAGGGGGGRARDLAEAPRGQLSA